MKRAYRYSLIYYTHIHKEYMGTRHIAHRKAVVCNVDIPQLYFSLVVRAFDSDLGVPGSSREVGVLRSL